MSEMAGELSADKFLIDALTPTGSESTTPDLPPTTVATQEPTPSVYRDEQGRFTTRPPEQTQETQTQPEATQSEQQTQDAFTKVDPNTLAPELQEIYKSLQADYTRKTQEVAEQRKRFEWLGDNDPDVVKEAIELHSTLRDPASWQALHAELTAGLRALGLTPQEAAQEATRQVQEQAAKTQPEFDLEGLDDDVAPLANLIKTQQNELASIKRYMAQRDAWEREQRYQMAILGEWQRQQNAILQANTHYTDDDMDAITELASFHDGNLLDAQKRYEEIRAQAIEKYIADKESVPMVSSPLGGGAVVGTEAPKIETMEDAKRLAIEFEEMLKENS